MKKLQGQSDLCRIKLRPFFSEDAIYLIQKAHEVPSTHIFHYKEKMIL
jgi:hypothetical protein